MSAADNARTFKTNRSAALSRPENMNRNATTCDMLFCALFTMNMRVGGGCGGGVEFYFCIAHSTLNAILKYVDRLRGRKLVRLVCWLLRAVTHISRGRLSQPVDIWKLSTRFIHSHIVFECRRRARAVYCRLIFLKLIPFCLVAIWLYCQVNLHALRARVCLLIFAKLNELRYIFFLRKVIISSNKEYILNEPKKGLTQIFAHFMTDCENCVKNKIWWA